MTDIAYCFHCRKMMPTYRDEEHTTQRIKGRTIEFDMVYCRCKECRGLCYDAETTEENVRRIKERLNG